MFRCDGKLVINSNIIQTYSSDIKLYWHKNNNKFWENVPELIFFNQLNKI